MTLTSGFFNSVNGDRLYDAEDFGEVFEGIIEDGVHKGIGTNLVVTAAGTGRNLTIGRGRAWFNKTWVYNDAPLPMQAAEASNAFGRIDAVILRINRDPTGRDATIQYIQGVAASFPVRPTLVKSELINEYALAYISRTVSGNVITNAEITNMVGTAETPYAVSRLLDRSFESPVMHRNVFRGKNLGTSITQAQINAIQSGSFEDIYVGDYWFINSQRWRVVDLDYFYGIGTNHLSNPSRNARNVHHAVIMPDKTLREGKLNEDFFKANGGAYYHTDARRIHFPAIAAIVDAAIPPAIQLNWEQIFSWALSGGMISDARWANGNLELPNQIQMFGHDLFGPRNRGENLPPTIQTEANTQFSLFKLNRQFIRAANDSSDGLTPTFWLRDILGPVSVAVVGWAGDQTYLFSSNPYGFRPFLCIG